MRMALSLRDIDSRAIRTVRDPRPRRAQASEIARARGGEGEQRLSARGCGRRSRQHCRFREQRHGQRRRSIAELLGRNGKEGGRMRVSRLVVNNGG